MKKIFLLLIALLVIPILALAQDNISLGPVIGNGRLLGAKTYDGQTIVGVLGIDSSGNTTIQSLSTKTTSIPGTLTVTGNTYQTGSIITGAASVVADVTTPQVYVLSSSGTVPQLSMEQATLDAVGVVQNFYKTRKTDATADTIVASGDKIASLVFKGANGATFDNAAQIIVTVDATPGASADMPGAIDFQLSPDGSATTASALKLANDKSATFGGTITGATSVTTTGAVTSTGLLFPTANEEAVAGAGTTVSDAAALSATKHVHQLTGANGTVGWKFATSVAAQFEFLLNTTAGVPKVYGASGGTCNGGATDAACTLVTGIVAHLCYSTAVNTWICS